VQCIKAVAHGIRVRRRRVAAQTKRPAGKILAIEQVHPFRGRDGRGQIRGENGRGREDEEQASRNCEMLHGRSLSPRSLNVKNSGGFGGCCVVPVKADTVAANQKIIIRLNR
jgi:hypothetical protein